MEPLEEKVAAFIQANAMFRQPTGVLLAVSGGADSVALLHVLHMLRRQGLFAADLFCLHVDHQLRGDESRADARFVAALTDRLGIPCRTRAVDVTDYARRRRVSIETAGRQLRLSCFTEVARSLGCNWVATGHQKNDHAETILQRLRRGTGYRGLRGIPPTRPLAEDIVLARPLLSSTRAEIVAYLRCRDLTWREDSSNADRAYTRNLVRHSLLPALQREARGSLLDELAELGTSAARLHDRIRREAGELAARCVESFPNHVALDVQKLATAAPPIAAELIRMHLVRLGCGERDLTSDHYSAILSLVRSEDARGAITLPGGFAARRDPTRLLLAGAGTGACLPTADRVELPIPGEVSFADHTIRAEVAECPNDRPFQIPADKTPFTEYLDLDRVGRPLIVRHRRPGDSFRPLGQRGPKKVGKFLTTAKVPPNQRERVILFDDGRRIVWVCPVRISEEVKVTPQTRHLLILRVT